MIVCAIPIVGLAFLEKTRINESWLEEVSAIIKAWIMILSVFFLVPLSGTLLIQALPFQ